MKLPWGRMKKWKFVWIGVLAGLGLGVGDIVYRSLTNPNVPPFFYAQPYVWLAQSLIPLIKPPGQPPEHFRLFFIAAFLGYFIYFAVLGALPGLLFQFLLWVFRRLKRHDAS